MSSQRTLFLPVPSVSEDELRAAARQLPRIRGRKPSVQRCLADPLLRKTLAMQVQYGDKKYD